MPPEIDSLLMPDNRSQISIHREYRQFGLFAKASNQAIACSAGKYVLLLNPDTVVGESTLSQVIAAMERNPKIGGLGYG